ncbi:MAG TPA: hypothetical protein VD994_15005 [Prosthecobacter sp.]|nr:hypothetical protein [Prosthecobacter sp.]
MSATERWMADPFHSHDGKVTIRVLVESEPDGTDFKLDPIATVYKESNALLVAAAPEMLRALRGVAFFLGRNADLRDLPTVKKVVEEAIAKAEGRQP